MENNPNAQHEIHYKKALAAFKLGEIYEANVQIRRALELNPSDEIINLAREIKSALGQKALQKAKQYKETKQWAEALEEAKKAESDLPESFQSEVAELIQELDKILNSKSSVKKWITRLVVVSATTVVVWGAWYLYNYNDEHQRWKLAQNQDNLKAYQSYLATFPSGNYSALARARMKEINEQDDQLWIQAISYPSKSTLSKYIESMESLGGMHLDEAFYMLDSVEFNVAARTGTQEALRSYIQTHPEGNFIQTAQQMLKTLVTPEEKIELIAYMKSFYELFQSGAYSELLQYFNPVTPIFMNQANISKADLLTTFEASKNPDVVREEIQFDDSSVVVTKNAEGIISMSYIVDSRREVKGAYT
ncbi:MAG: hypothetical protein RLZZ252_1673, partial [Bacteroidota bacterium]